MELVFLVIGLLLGGFVCFIYFKSQISKQESVETERLTNLQQAIDEFKAEINEKSQEIINLSKQLQGKETELKLTYQRFDEQKKEVEQLREKFNLEFKNLANEILEEKTKKFTQENKTNLDQILKPLKENIKEFELKVERTHTESLKGNAALREQIINLKELNQQITKETINLTKALKGESKTQGNWGEMILESILERTGLKKDEEYFVQQSHVSPEGKRYQPDVIVNYPGNRSIVIDSKVSLTAYERYVNATDETEQKQALTEHLQSVKNHIIELSNKNYQDLEGVQTLDYVVMFMPIEPSYLIAVQNDPNLWNFAYEKRILLISSTNLIAVLKMIESLWRQEYQSRNVMEIARQGGDLYDKFCGLMDDLLDVGKKLQATQKSYEDSMNKLSTGKGNLVRRVENLKELGVKVKKQLPDKLVDRALEEEN